MKSFVLIFSFLFAGQLIAQRPVTFEAVVHVDSAISKSDLYNRGHHWIVKVFNRSNDAIVLNDPEGGQIVVKGYHRYNQSRSLWGGADLTEGYINFTVKLMFKDGRFKYVVTDFIHEADKSFGLITDSDSYQGKMSMTSKNWRLKIWKDIKSQIDRDTKALILSLTTDMTVALDSELVNW